MRRLVFEKNEADFPFVAYVPDKIEKPLPVILQLHGAGEAGEGGERLDLVDVHGFTKLFSKKERDCILILPQCSKDSFWVAEIQKIRQFIENIKYKFNIDEKRIYLTGLSMGGYGTWYTALAFPEIFAAIAPVCGGGMMWKANILDKMPIWAFHGTEDETVLVSESINMIKAVRKFSTDDVRLTILDGVGHNAWEKAYSEELYNWLMSKSL